VEYGRLPGAVRADQGEDLPLGDLEAEPAQRVEAAEADREIFDAEHRLLGIEPVRQRREVPLLDADPQPSLLRLVVGADRERRQDAALVALDRLERRDQRLARQVPAGA